MVRCETFEKRSILLKVKPPARKAYAPRPLQNMPKNVTEKRRTEGWKPEVTEKTSAYRYCIFHITY